MSLKPKNLTKADIAKRVMSTTNTTLKAATTSVEETLMAITDALKKGDHVEIRGFGSFRCVTRAPRVGRNPHKPTQLYDIPARRKVIFRPGKELLATIA